MKIIKIFWTIFLLTLIFFLYKEFSKKHVRLNSARIENAQKFIDELVIREEGFFEDPNHNKKSLDAHKAKLIIKEKNGYYLQIDKFFKTKAEAKTFKEAIEKNIQTFISNYELDKTKYILITNNYKTKKEAISIKNRLEEIGIKSNMKVRF